MVTDNRWCEDMSGGWGGSMVEYGHICNALINKEKKSKAASDLSVMDLFGGRVDLAYPGRNLRAFGLGLFFEACD